MSFQESAFPPGLLPGSIAHSNVCEWMMLFLAAAAIAPLSSMVDQFIGVLR